MAGHAILAQFCIPTSKLNSLASPCLKSRRHQISSTHFLASPWVRCLDSHKERESSVRCSVGLAWRVGLFSADIADENERLKDAAKAGDLKTLNEILGFAGVSIDLPSDTRAGWTALHLASFYGHPSIVESLLKAGANLEVRNESGNTALQLASLKGNIDIARILLESGADFYAQSSDKGTALEYAQEWGGDEMVDFLLLWAAKTK